MSSDSWLDRTPLLGGDGVLPRRRPLGLLLTGQACAVQAGMDNTPSDDAVAAGLTDPRRDAIGRSRDSATLQRAVLKQADSVAVA